MIDRMFKAIDEYLTDRQPSSMQSTLKRPFKNGTVWSTERNRTVPDAKIITRLPRSDMDPQMDQYSVSDASSGE
ncbi:hypothetical protein Tco_1017045 [Tanacetum coccineum]|uniref:Uncharacterized protein n=1 Tax=Tanacetum coccineum TaxID=301880 RepID=A0ABQ5FRK8_9ASTR